MQWKKRKHVTSARRLDLPDMQALGFFFSDFKANDRADVEVISIQGRKAFFPLEPSKSSFSRYKFFWVIPLPLSVWTQVLFDSSFREDATVLSFDPPISIPSVDWGYKFTPPEASTFLFHSGPMYSKNEEASYIWLGHFSSHRRPWLVDRKHLHTQYVRFKRLGGDTRDSSKYPTINKLSIRRTK